MFLSCVYIYSLTLILEFLFYFQVQICEEGALCMLLSIKDMVTCPFQIPILILKLSRDWGDVSLPHEPFRNGQLTFKA